MKKMDKDDNFRFEMKLPIIACKDFANKNNLHLSTLLSQHIKYS